MKFNSEAFNNDYFQNGIKTGVSLYDRYRWLPELTMSMGMAMIDYLDIRREHRVLDYGCSRGYLVKALTLLHRVAYGTDISEYAINHCDDEVEGLLRILNKDGTIPFKTPFDFGISKDVLEHVPYEHIDFVFEQLSKHCKKLFIVVPLGENRKYRIPQYEYDTTHIIRKNDEWWAQKMGQFFTDLTVEDHVIGIKDNWYDVNPKGNACLFGKSSNVSS